MSNTVVMAVEDDWKSAHILGRPSSKDRALCGHRPTLVWRRVWVEESRDPSLLPACTECRDLVVELDRDAVVLA